MSLEQAIVELAQALPIEEHFSWDVPPDCPISIPETVEGSFCRNFYLKENLAPLLENDTDRKSHFWIIQKWGGIRTFKDTPENQRRIHSFERQLCEGKMTREIFGVISSLSKVASFKKADTYSIYDSRVIFALNWLLFCHTEKPNLFPQPLGRNAELADIDANTLMTLSGRSFTVRSHKTAYFEYCDLMKKVAKEALKQERPYHAEMLLFAAAPKWIVADIKRRTTVTIETGPSAPVMQKS